MALYYNHTWTDTTQDYRAKSLSLEMAEDLFDDKVWIYLTTAAIVRKLNKLCNENLGTAYATAYSLHSGKCSNLSISDSEFRMNWKEE